MSDDGVVATEVDAVLRIRITRPDRGNSLRPHDMSAMLDALTDASTSDTLRAVLIEAAGKNFCTGAELGRPAAADAPQRTGQLMRRLDGAAHRLAPAIWHHPLPIVAAVRGHAAGLGCQLAFASDFIVAQTGALFSTPFVRRGFSPDSTSSYLVPRLVGLPLARRMLLRGVPISAEDLAARDVVELAAPADFGKRVDDLLAELVASPTVAVGLAKRVLHSNLDRDIERAGELEALAVELSVRSPDFKEGLRAFSERRPPEFSGS